jgi:outer membrane receptor for ferrienterochelin and colicins
LHGLLAAFGAVLALAAHAREAPGSAAAALRWDFTLATLDGSRFVRLSDVRGPVLVNFWGVDCPPCVAELPLLLAFARDNPAWTLLLVGTDPPAAARAFAAKLPQPLPGNVVMLRGATHARALLREAGSPHGGLPHTVAVAEQGVGDARDSCAVHAGLVDGPWLRQAAQRCR